MVRGHAKEVAQQKNAAKNKEKKGSNLGAGAKKTTMVCPICKVCGARARLRFSVRCFSRVSL